MSCLAIVTTDLTIGGAQSWIVNISRILVQHEHEVHLILFRGIIDLELHPKVQVHILHKGPEILGTRFSKYLASISLRKIVASIGRLELIISTLPFADQITRMSKVQPVFYRIANTLSSEVASLGNTKGMRRKRRYKKLYCDQSVISVSNGVKHDLVNYFDLSERNITTIYNPIDQERLSSLAKSERCETDEPYIVHSGRFEKQKRHDVLLDAFKHYLDNAKPNHPQKLIILTEKSSLLDKMINDRNLNRSVKNIGFQSNPFPWYYHASCLVLSSDHEGMPNVILEALALGTPVASTDCPSGPSELLGSFYPECLCSTGNPVALADVIFNALQMDMELAKSILEPFRPARIMGRLVTLCGVD